MVGTVRQSKSGTDFFADIIAAINYTGEENSFQKTELANVSADSAPTLRERLNLMIGAGASFDVSRDDFQVFGEGFLTNEEKHFLSVNKDFVLCQVQQSLLMKHLSKEEIAGFIDEVKERLAIVSDGGETRTQIQHFEIVSDVVKRRFADLLDAIAEPGTNLKMEKN